MTTIAAQECEIQALAESLDHWTKNVIFLEENLGSEIRINKIQGIMTINSLPHFSVNSSILYKSDGCSLCRLSKLNGLGCQGCLLYKITKAKCDYPGHPWFIFSRYLYSLDFNYYDEFTTKRPKIDEELIDKAKNMVFLLTNVLNTLK